MDNEVNGEGNSYTTHFRQLDPQIARWKSLDPKRNASESPYVSMANNPIWFNDPMGDTITTTQELMEDEFAYEGHMRFMASRAGRKIQRLYGEGGKRYGTNVVFGLQNSKHSSGGTQAVAINNLTGVETFLANEEDKVAHKSMGYNTDNQRTYLEEDERLEFRIYYSGTKDLTYLTPTVRFDGKYRARTVHDNIEDAWEEACMLRNNVAFSRGLTGVHESQHLRLMHADFLKDGRFNLGSYNQHFSMKNGNTWFKERSDYVKLYRPDTLDKDIRSIINNFEY